MHICYFIRVNMYTHTVIHMAAAQKHRACNGPARPFCDKACNRMGGLATNPPCDKPIEDCSTLHRGPRQGFVTEGPQQRFVAEGRTATNPDFEPYRYIYIYRDRTMHAGVYIHVCFGGSISLSVVAYIFVCIHVCSRICILGP